MIFGMLFVSDYITVLPYNILESFSGQVPVQTGTFYFRTDYIRNHKKKFLLNP